ncbi:hypothetical protein CsSME_00034011 [Camellia sinensis var. sinensis]|uniref:probable calcium-binding protein CML22 isoform X2 n=1 Tax=Camellia sinensis TaxID=4442 RepID=UPI00103633BF|nr:probable calcium-binding protein CML22 isoform X2 [Camellia sinensis]
MKESLGSSGVCLALKSLPNKLGGMFCFDSPPNKYKKLDAKLEKKMMEVKRSALRINNFRSINGIIMKFPQIKEVLKDIRGVFEHYDEDSNGTIDNDELKKCVQKLQLHLAEKEIDDLFDSCDLDGSAGIQFKEFMVLLCLIYLLTDYSNSPHTLTSKMGSPQLEATFDIIVEAFLFLDKNGDGKLNKKDIVKSLNEDFPWEKSPAHVTRARFKEMDWDGKGNVSFREFLFSFINWVGVDTDENHVTGSKT